MLTMVFRRSHCIELNIMLFWAVFDDFHPDGKFSSKFSLCNHHLFCIWDFFGVRRSFLYIRSDSFKKWANPCWSCLFHNHQYYKNGCFIHLYCDKQHTYLKLRITLPIHSLCLAIYGNYRNTNANLLTNASNEDPCSDMIQFFFYYKVFVYYNIQIDGELYWEYMEDVFHLDYT